MKVIYCYIFFICKAQIIFGSKKYHTVELGYNDHGYNKYTVITNKMRSLVWFSMFYQKIFMVITNRFSELHSYNEQILYKSQLLH